MTYILVIPGDGSAPIKMRVTDERDGVLTLDDGETRWTVRSVDVIDGKVVARKVYLVPNQY